MRYVLYCTISDIFCAIAYFSALTHPTGPIYQGFWCQWISFWSIFGNLCGAGFNVLTATYVFLCLMRKKPGNLFEGLSQINWLTSLLLGLLGYMITTPERWNTPVIFGASCFISEEYYLARTLMVHLVMGLSSVYVFLLYIAVAIYVHKNARGKTADERKDKKKKRAIVYLAVYPIIFFFFWCWRVLTGLIAIGSQNAPNVPPIAMVQFSVMLVPWLGFVNALWYSYTKGIITELKKKLRSDFPGWKIWGSQPDRTTDSELANTQTDVSKTSKSKKSQTDSQLTS